MRQAPESWQINNRAFNAVSWNLKSLSNQFTILRFELPNRRFQFEIREALRGWNISNCSAKVLVHNLRSSILLNNISIFRKCWWHRIMRVPEFTDSSIKMSSTIITAAKWTNSGNTRQILLLCINWVAQLFLDRFYIVPTYFDWGKKKHKKCERFIGGEDDQKLFSKKIEKY